MKPADVSKSYNRITLYVYFAFYFALFLWTVKIGAEEIIVKGEGIYKTIVTSIFFLLFIPLFFVFPIGASFIFSHIYIRKKINLFVAWLMSFFVLPITIAGVFLFKCSFELLYIILIILLIIILILAMFHTKLKWVIAILLIYISYIAELYFAEILTHV